MVCGTGALPSPTAELAWGLILALPRHIPAEDRSMREGGWQHTIGPELAGRTLGLLGLGRLGRRMAAIGRAFEMPVIAWSQNLRPEDAAAARRRGGRQGGSSSRARTCSRSTPG